MELGRIVLLKIIKEPLEAFSKRTEISNKNIKGFVILFVSDLSTWEARSCSSLSTFTDTLRLYLADRPNI